MALTKPALLPNTPLCCPNGLAARMHVAMPVEPPVVLSLALPVSPRAAQGGNKRKIPFATVVTDLGSAHPSWMNDQVDVCFVPSDAVRKMWTALRSPPRPFASAMLCAPLAQALRPSCDQAHGPVPMHPPLTPHPVTHAHDHAHFWPMSPLPCSLVHVQVRNVAEKRGLTEDQIRQYGLPVRPSFWRGTRSKEMLTKELGLEKMRKTVLVVGGGDGVGSLGAIVEATATELGRTCPDGAQVVAVCGKNEELRARLAAKSFANVNVHVCGFVKQMSDYMAMADILITKAGPGTIAEATIRGETGGQ